MSLSGKTRNVIIAVFLAIVGIFVFGYVLGHKSGKSALNPTITALNKEISRVTVELNNQKLYVTSIEQELTTLKQAKADGDVTAKELRVLNLKQVNEITRLKLKIDTLLEVSNNANVVFIHDSLDQVAVLLPFVVTKTDQWLSLKDSTDIKGKTSIALSMDVPIDLYTGIDSKSKLPIAKITTSNPYIGVLSISSMKLDNPVNKPKKIGIGFFVGYGINISGTVKASPVLGAGLSYNLIRF